MTVTPEAFRSLIEKRQSIRFFDSRTIPLSVLEEIIDDAQQAPNDCNHQSWKFVVVTDETLKERIVAEAGSCEPARRAPVLIIPIIQSGWNHNKFSIIQTLAAATNTLLLSAKTRGIDGIWMAGIGNTESIRKLLGIPPAYIIDCFVGFGYAKESSVSWPKAPRPPVQNIYSLNRFDFDTDSIYPLKMRDQYDFHSISNQRNPYALWDPKYWTLKQIALFRGNAVWAGSPSPSLHKSRRLLSEFMREVEIAKQHLKAGKTLVLLPYSGAYSAALLKDIPDLDLVHFEISSGHELMIKKRLTEEGIKKEIPFFSLNGAFKVPFPDGSFSNLLIFQGIETVPEPDRLIRESERLLANGGRLILTCRNSWSWLSLKYFFSTRKETVWNFGPYKPLSPAFVYRITRTMSAVKWLGISPLPSKIGTLVTKWPIRFFCRLFVFIGEKHE